VLFTLAGHSGRVWVSFVPDNRSLVSWGDDATLRVWDATTGKAAKNLLREKTATTALRWAPDGKSAAVALAAGTARVYALPGWDERVVYTDPAHGVSAVAFSPDGGRLAVGTDGGGLKVFDTKSWTERADCAGHSDRVLAGGLFFTPDGARLVSASRDATIRVWDATTGAKVRSVPAPADLVAVLPTPDPDRVVEVDRGFGARNVSVRDLRTGATAARFAKQGSATAALTVSPDGRYLWDATAGDCTVWDLTTLKEAGRVPDLSGTAFAFVPGTPWLLAAAESGHEARLGVFRVSGAGAVRLRGVEGHAKPIVSLAVSPDGRLAATGDEDGTIKVWDVAALTRP
jgi:WD40 repeat protein